MGWIYLAESEDSLWPFHPGSFLSPTVRTIGTARLSLSRNGIDIIYGGFPCQDISTMGAKRGLEGERSGLFRDVIRLTEELRPSFVFIENVSRGIGKIESDIAKAFEELGYQARAAQVSAFECGANQERFRWFCLAHSYGSKLRISTGRRKRQKREKEAGVFSPTWWASEPGVSGVAHGIPHRVDRHRALGNAVVPLQAREAFKRLMGLEVS